MIVETITAFAAVKITWETLEIMHLLHVGHLAGETGYKGGSYLIQGLQQRYQKIRDNKNPAEQLEREAETLYNYRAPQATTIQEINNEAQKYLNVLEDSIKHLKTAQKYFEEISKRLNDLVAALPSNKEQPFLFHLIKLESKLLAFKLEITQFLHSLAPPPRQILYIADSLDGKIIQQYNSDLASIKDCIVLLGKTEKAIAEQFQQALESVNTWLIKKN